MLVSPTPTPTPLSSPNTPHEVLSSLKALVTMYGKDICLSGKRIALSSRRLLITYHSEKDNYAMTIMRFA